MTPKIKTIQAAGLLAAFRDETLAIAQQLDNRLEEITRAYKEEAHALKIKRNQLMRKADEIQEMIGMEMQANLDEQKRVDEQWSYKSTSQMSNGHG